MADKTGIRKKDKILLVGVGRQKGLSFGQGFEDQSKQQSGETSSAVGEMYRQNSILKTSAAKPPEETCLWGTTCRLSRKGQVRRERGTHSREDTSGVK